MRRGVDDQRLAFALQSVSAEAVIRPALARTQQRDQGAGGRGVVDHAAPRVGEAEHLPQPIGHDFLDFRERRT
jgi:hypothetical protein